MIPSPLGRQPRAAAALDSLQSSGPLPRLVWAGTGERLELSGRVSATWANKVANLLVEEIDAGPGTRVFLDLPLHWRTLTWALGTWATGACVVVDRDRTIDSHANDDDDHLPALPPALDALVTASQEVATRAVAEGIELVVLVPLASFALRVPGGTPPGALDGAADVAAQPDDLGPVRPAPVGDPQLEFIGPAGETDPWWALAAVAEWADGGDVRLEG